MIQKPIKWKSTENAECLIIVSSVDYGVTNGPRIRWKHFVPLTLILIKQKQKHAVDYNHFENIHASIFKDLLNTSFIKLVTVTETRK